MVQHGNVSCRLGCSQLTDERKKIRVLYLAIKDTTLEHITFCHDDNGRGGGKEKTELVSSMTEPPGT